MVLRGSPWFKATAQAHEADVQTTFEKEFPPSRSVYNLLQIADHGPDHDHESVKVQLAEYCEWLRLGLALRITVYHAPGNSFLNPIEGHFHLLDPIIGVEFPEVYPGDVLPPQRESDLTPVQRDTKERFLFDQAFKIMEKIWGDVTLCGQSVDVTHVYPEARHTPHTACPLAVPSIHTMLPAHVFFLYFVIGI
jgi:hypothetical protein